MTNTMKLPVGIERFDEIRTMRFYYVDKTKLIEELLENWGKVNLFTRPRRFGKTLNMSMLQCFFEIGTDGALFDGLYISKNRELCDAHMGKYPVIFVSLKDVDGLTYEDAFARLKTIILREAARHAYLNVRRHTVGGTNSILISANLPRRLCRIGTCRRLSAG